MAVKRAIRRLFRLPDGTIGVKYFDLATNMEILDLTGYDILEPGQETQLPGQAQSDNRDDEQVEINPTSRGSSDRPTRGRDNDSSPNYLSGIKNPAIKDFLTQVEQNKTAPAPSNPAYGETDGDVTVTPDSEIADREWAGVENDNISEDASGNVTISDPNNPNRTSVFTGLDQNRFNPGLQQAVENSNKPAAPATPTEASNGMFGLGEGLVDRAGLAPGSTGLYSDSMKNLGLGTPASLYTAAQENVAKGVTQNFSAVRPEGVPAGMPAARQSVAKSVINNAVRPEAPATGMPAARPSQTTIAGRPATPAMTGLPAAQPSMTNAAARPEGTASGLPGAAPTPGAVRSPAARAAINAGIMSQDSFATRPSDTISAERAAQAKAQASETGVTGGLGSTGTAGIGSDAVAGRTSTDLGTQPDSSRYGDFGGISKATKAAVNPSTGMQMAPDIGTTANPAGARPEGIASGMPAAPGRFSNTMSVPGSAKPAGSVTAPSELGKNAGIGGIYGEKSTAQSVISGARDVSTNNKNQGVPQGTAVSATGAPGKPTSYKDAAGYSQTDVSGVRSTRNNNPGNLEASSWTQSQPGYIGNDSRFAVFDSFENGVKAQAALLGTKNYKGLTISQAIARYAPPTENNTTAYTKAVTDALGLPSNTKMSELSAAQRVSMMNAMHEVEGGVGGITGVKTSLTAKGIAAATGYTGPNTGPDTPSEMGAAGRSGLGFGGSGSSSGSGSAGGFSSSGIGAARAADRGSVSGYSGGAKSGAQGGSSYGGGSSGPGGTAGKSASGGVSGASRSTAGKGGQSPSSKSGGISGASRSTAGKTSGSSGYGSTGGGGVSGAGVGQGGIGSR